MKRMFKIAAVAALFTAIALSASRDVHAEQGKAYPALSSFYDMKCKIECQVYSQSHLFLNKYDVDVYLDDKKVGTIHNSETFSGTGNVMPGIHELVFKKSSDSSVAGSWSFDVQNDERLSCELDCAKTEIKVVNTKKSVSNESKAVIAPWRYDAVLAQANDYIYDKIITSSEIAQTQYDCFTMFFPDDKMFYVFIKCDPSVDGSKFSEISGHELGKILSSSGLDSSFIFADMNGDYVEEYDSNGNESELKTLSNWKEEYLKEYWGK